uniref:Reverse transcriptase zinc-binding domain-containing protein n=1 Tax=Hordeum vulgare subsp. vulgare TaxID=112509 RepID=A0A8I6Y6S5_HORVV
MLIMDKLNTKDMVERRHWHMDDGVNCGIFHAQVREDRDHLFFTCLFSSTIWNYLQIDWVIQLIWQLLSPMLKVPSNTLFSLRWCSLHVDIFG